MAKAKVIDWSKAPFSYVDSKRGSGRCAAYGCNCKGSPKRRYLCPKHYHRLTKYLDPVYYRYMLWKSRAKQRNKPFTVRLCWFRNFCIETGYVIDPVRCPKNLSIDRPDNNRGYHEDNVQLMPIKDNQRKYWDKDRYERAEGFQVPNDYKVNQNFRNEDVDESDDLPF